MGNNIVVPLPTDRSPQNKKTRPKKGRVIPRCHPISSKLIEALNKRTLQRFGR